MKVSWISAFALLTILALVVPASATYTDAIGFKWDTSSDSPTLTRVFANGTTASVDGDYFNNHAIWGNIKKVLVNSSTGAVTYGSNNRGDGLDLNGTGRNQVMVEYPMFYTFESYNAPFLTYIVSPTQYNASFVVHPLFYQRGDGTPAAHYYVGAYEMQNETIGGVNYGTSYTGKAPLVLQTIGQMRTAAEANGEGWGLINVWTGKGLNELLFIETGTLNSQIAWAKSRGVVDDTAAKAAGADSADTNIFAVNATGGGTGTNGLTPEVWRAYESSIGGVWEFWDGQNSYTSGGNSIYRNINRTGLNLTGGQTKFQDLLIAGDYETSTTTTIANGYQTSVATGAADRLLMIPTGAGGSETTYLADYFYYPQSTNAAAPNILLAGGSWYYAGYAGAGAWHSGSGASDSNADVGARLEFRPSLTTASFTANTTGGVAPLPVLFTDTSTNFPTAWKWMFANLTHPAGEQFSTLQNPEHVFPAGNYTINLTATNSGGSNTSTQLTWINVTSSATAPTASFTSTGNATSSVYPSYVQFTDTSSGGPTTWLWEFGDGTNSTLQNPKHFYSVAGIFPVKLTVNNTIGDSNLTISDYVSLTSDVDANVTAWSHFDGVDGSTTIIDEVGTSPIASGGAALSSTQQKFGATSLALLTNDAMVQAPSTTSLNLDNLDVAIEFCIYPTAPSASPIFKRSTGNNGISDGWGIRNNGTEYGYTFWMGNSAVNDTQAFTLPNNQWSHLAVLINSTANRGATIYVNGNLITSKLYPGAYDTTNPLMFGAKGGGTEWQGYIDEFRLSIGNQRWANYATQFNTPPVAYIGDLYSGETNPDSLLRFKTTPPDFGLITNQTKFTQTVQIQNVTNVKYVIGSSSYNPAVLEASNVRVNTSYYADLSLVSSSINPVSGTVYFNVTRAAGFNAGTDRVSFLDVDLLYAHYKDPATGETDIQTFGNGWVINATDLKTYPVHQFLPTNITYADWVIMTGFSGMPTAVAVGSPVSFTDESTGAPTKWLWNFGDLTSSSAQNPTKAYSSEGSYNVTLTASLLVNTSVTNSTTKTYYINVSAAPPSAPIAAFSANMTTVPLGTPIGFTDESLFLPTGWEWDFGDYGSSAQQNPVYTYSATGTYNVSLKASNAQGNNTLTKPNYITVIPLVTPIANFTANVTSDSIPLAVQFTDTSLNYPTSWYWLFGDGNFSLLKNPVHTYTAVGNYTINLTATNGAGANTTSKTNYINAAAFTWFNQQDIELEKMYALTLQVNDAKTGYGIPSVTVSDNLGNIYNTSANGTVSMSYEYSVIVLTLTKEDYSSKQVSYIISEDSSRTTTMTPVSKTQTTTWYSPHQVRFEVLNTYGNKISGVSINATANISSMPADYLTDLYGVSPDVANEMMNNTLKMTAVTGDDGAAVFTMHGSIYYDLRMTNPATGALFFRSIMPIDNQYNLRLESTVLPNLSGNVYQNIANTSLTFSEPNNSYITMGLTYHDTSGKTSNVKFYVIFAENRSTAYSVDLGNPGTSAAYANYTTRNIRGLRYIWNYTAERS